VQILSVLLKEQEKMPAPATILRPLFIVCYAAYYCHWPDQLLHRRPVSAALPAGRDQAEKSSGDAAVKANSGIGIRAAELAEESQLALPAHPGG
jgi:hypothetical protein